MIVALSGRVSQQLETNRQLELTQQQALDVTQTAEEARKLRESVQNTVLFFQLIQSRLQKGEQKRLCDLLASLAADVANTRQEFAKAPRQVNALRQLQTRGAQIRLDAEGCWHSYATGKVQPQTELLRLVQQLPEMRVQFRTINELVERLRRSADGTPKTASDLAQFDAALAELTKASSQLQGLGPAVRNFLAMVIAGRATVADLTSEVLEWCRQGERDKALQITFKS